MDEDDPRRAMRLDGGTLKLDPSPGQKSENLDTVVGFPSDRPEPVTSSEPPPSTPSQAPSASSRPPPADAASRRAVDDSGASNTTRAALTHAGAFGLGIVVTLAASQLMAPSETEAGPVAIPQEASEAASEPERPTVDAPASKAVSAAPRVAPPSATARVARPATPKPTVVPTDAVYDDDLSPATPTPSPVLDPYEDGKPAPRPPSPRTVKDPYE